MSAMSIVMMLVALCTVWGGLVGAILHLRRHPDATPGEVD
jgi:hypothetical protein